MAGKHPHALALVTGSDVDEVWIYPDYESADAAYHKWWEDQDVPEDEIDEEIQQRYDGEYVTWATVRFFGWEGIPDG